MDEHEIRELLEQLRNPEEDARLEALVKLSSCEEDTINQYFLDQLDDPNPVIRKYCIEILGKRKERRAVGPIIEKLNDSEEYYRLAAIKALCLIGEPAAVDHVIAACRRIDPGFLYVVAQSLANFGTAATDRLVGLLRDENRTLRSMAAQSLACIGDPSAVYPLIDALGDDFAEVGLFARNALVRIGKPSIEPLIRVSRDLLISRLAVDALSEIGGNEVESAVLDSYDDADALRRKAAQDLARKGLLHIKFDDTIPGMGEAALSLSRLGKALALARIGGEKAIRKLLGGLNDPNNLVQAEAIEALGGLKAREAVQPLIRLLKSSECIERQVVVEALGTIGDPAAFDALMAEFNNKESDVRGVAAEALGQIGDSRALQSLLKEFENSESGVRSHILSGLARFDNAQSASAIIRSVDDSDYSVKSEAIRIIGERRIVAGVEGLIRELRNSESEVQDECMEALTNIGEPAIKKVLADWAESSEEGKNELLCIMEDIGLEKIIPVLEKQVSESDENKEWLVVLLELLRQAGW